MPRPILLLALVAAAMTAAAQECFPLTGSQTCSDLAQYSVRSVANSFTNVAQFDDYIWGQMTNSSSYISEFKNFYNCPGSEGTMQRYRMSVMCYFLVQGSDCTQSTPVVPLCKSSCNQYVETLTTIFANDTICPVNDVQAIQYRQLALGSAGYAPFCDSLVANNAGTDCSLGVFFETHNCGFVSVAEGNEFCIWNPKETCCTEMHTEAVQGISNSLMDTNNNIWIISGVAVGVGVIIVILFILYIRSKGWHRQTTTAVQPVDYSKGDTDNRKSNRFTKRLSKSMGALFKPKGRNAVKSYQQSPSPFKNGGPNYQINDWENEPLPPMPNVTTIRKKNTLPRTNNPEMQQQSFNPAPLSVMTNAPILELPMTADYNNGAMSAYTDAQSMPQKSAAPSMPSMYNPNGVASYLPDTQFTLMKAMEEFFPNLDDEIQLQMGDRVQVVENFDDGWAVGKNLTSNEVGAFPIACLAPMETIIDASNNRKSEYMSRTHSLYAPRK